MYFVVLQQLPVLGLEAVEYLDPLRQGEVLPVGQKDGENVHLQVLGVLDVLDRLVPRRGPVLGQIVDPLGRVDLEVEYDRLTELGLDQPEDLSLLLHLVEPRAGPQFEAVVVVVAPVAVDLLLDKHLQVPLEQFGNTLWAERLE